jgi:hypothetical protein
LLIAADTCRISTFGSGYSRAAFQLNTSSFRGDLIKLIME